MQKIVIDTNVLVSALIAKSFPSRIINELILGEKVSLCLSKDVWEEYVEVLNRERFLKYPSFKTNAEIVLSELENLAIQFQPDLKINKIKDEADNKFLELAVFANAEFIITGNTLDFTFEQFKDIQIVIPRDYWENHKPK